ncbi:MAG: DNA polymerase III subunit alpha [Patescibacteria group bacterium]|nr:DNA polymerase III subunit alpha [Patescibacteria group bacterium]
MSFVHLHTHSHFSLLDGLSQIDELVLLAKKYGMPAVALTDHGSMYGIIEFYQKCRKAGIKPVLGVEAYLARNLHTDKRPKVDDNPYHLLLLARNNVGYRNLIKLTTIAHLEGFYYKPRVDWPLLEKYHEGISVTSGCLQGELARRVLSGDLAGAREVAKRYRNTFGAKNFFLEVQHHQNIPEQKILNDAIFKLSEELGIPVVATADSHYPTIDDAYAQDVMLCIQTKKILTDTDRMTMIGDDFSFQSIEQMRGHFPDHPEVADHTVQLAESCHVELEFGKPLLPQYDVPGGVSPEAYLKQLCEQGLPERYGQRANAPEIQQRLRYELEVIGKTGFASYFLIVQDFINWAKKNRIVVGPGRGSAPGSIVSYLTRITDIDPIRYQLLFERFLNPERISMPDIDNDFADHRRDEVLQYVAEKYGRDHVAQIITFGTMAARASVRDVGRVSNLPYSYCDRVAKLIPPFMDLAQAVKTVPELQAVLADSNGRKLLTTAQRLEGCARHASTHACGVVITKEPLDHYVPQQPSTEGTMTMTQYEMHAIDDLGLLKIDFLGLRNLTVIENTLEILRKARGITIDLATLPLDDRATYKILARAETTGVFQLESSGMKRYLKQLKPSEFEDIIAMVSLYRPGPMELIPDYISGKHGLRKITYLDPHLEPILGKTYGIAVYQEQIMEIARQLAGFSYGEADVLRKAVGKKIAHLLAEQEEKMVSGMVKNGIKKSVAQKIWDFILPFARYGFNRSHAACYAMIAYQTAYLKAHYPAEFMAALLTGDQGDIDRVAIEVEECRVMELTVLPPDINESYSSFTVVYDSPEVRADKSSTTIRFGLTAVKNLGENVVKEIIHERKEHGPYQNLEDLLSRVKTKDLNKKSLEALVKSGALDRFGERGQLLSNLENLLSFLKAVNLEYTSNQGNLFSGMAQLSTLPKLRFDPTEPATDQQKVAWERELLGLFLSSHPLKMFAPHLKGKTVTLAELTANTELVGRSITVAGVLGTVKRVITRKGENMLFAKLEDHSGSLEVLVFPSILQSDPAVWQEDAVVAVRCRLSDRDGELKLICQRALPLQVETAAETLAELARDAETSGLANGFRSHAAAGGGPNVDAGAAYIVVPKMMDRQAIATLKQQLARFPGPYRVCLLIRGENGFRKIATSYSIADHSTLRNEISALLGPEALRFESQAA